MKLFRLCCALLAGVVVLPACETVPGDPCDIPGIPPDLCEPAPPGVPYDCDNPPESGGALLGPHVKGQWIVTFQPTLTRAFVAESMDMQAFAQSFAQQVDATFVNAFTGGMTIKATDAVIQQLLQRPDVRRVEPDQVITIPRPIEGGDAVRPSAVSGDNDRMAPPLDGKYDPPGNRGAGGRACVVDTGIGDHSEFGDRLSDDCFTAITFRGCTDGNGHGMHVASNIVGNEFGLADKATVHSARCLDENGSGQLSDCIRAVDFCTSLVAKYPNDRIVGNASIGGSKSPAFGDALARSVEAGVAWAVAAGNGSGGDACNNSPSDVSCVLTIAASDHRTDRLASFSDVGACVTGIAPGVSTEGAWIGGGTNVISGTSMATPNAAGVLLNEWSNHPEFTVAQLYAHVKALGQVDVVSGVPDGTANLHYVVAGQ